MKHLMFLLVIGLIGFSGCQENNTAKLDKSGNQTPQNQQLDSLNDLITDSPNDPNLYFERAKAYYRQKDLKSSLNDVGRSLRLDSSNVDYYILLASLKLLTKESRASRDALLSAYQIDPENVDVLLKLGELYMIVKDHEASFKYLNEALKVDVYNADAYRLKGFNYKFDHDTVNAISSFQTAVEQDPQDYDSYMQLGLLFADGRKEIAIDYFDNALRIRPTSLEAMYAKALFLQTTNEPREAITIYNDILSLNPNYFDAWYNIGYIHLESLQKYDSAAFNFSKAIEVGPPRNFPAIYNRGLSHERAGEWKEAERDYRKALELNPQYDLAANGLSRVLEKK